jgi:hypothetical protein
MRRHPPTLLAAAIVLVIEAAGVFIAAVLSGMDTAAGRSYQLSSGVALTVLAFFAVAVLAAIAAGLGAAKRWSRTPALLAQLFIGIAGITLLQGGRLEWGVPAMLLAVTGLAAVFAPPSMAVLVSKDRATARQ